MTDDVKFKLQQFTKQLNAEPDQNELDRTPDGNAQYLPVSFIEMTLDEMFFGLWSTQHFQWSALINEVQGSLELVLIHPVTGETIRRTGAASIVIMVDKLPDDVRNKMTAQDRNLYASNPANKKPNALDMAFPKLKAECLKNAAQSLGKRFGRDLNRKKSDSYKPVFAQLPDKALLAAIERVEKGQDANEVLAYASTAFAVSDEQKEMILGAKQRKIA